jgi:ATP-dependent Clp protease protease subunit
MGQNGLHKLDASEHEEEGEKSGSSDLDRLLKSRALLIHGAIHDKLTKQTINHALLLEQEDPEKDITVFLNSPGGSVTDGFAIFDTLRFIQPKVKIVCAGLCASIATIILLAAEKEHRLTLPHTRFLIHQPLIMGQVVGPASDLEITANEIIKTRSMINKMLARETGQPLSRVERDVQRDFWMRAEEAEDYGLIHRIISSRSDLD